jgi:subtilisin family serine protease
MNRRYIVTFEDSPSRDLTIDTFSKYQAKIIWLFQLIPAAAIEMDQERVEELEKEKVVKNVVSDVRSIEHDPFPFKFSDSDGNIWYRVPDYFDQDNVRKEEKGVRGFPSIAAVIDSGVDIEYPVLRGRVLMSYDCTGEGFTDFNGHGTIVASQLAKSENLDIINIKVANKKGVFWESDLMAGLEMAHKVATELKRELTVNLCLGIIDPNCLGNCPLCSMASAVTGNVLIVAAAGNTAGSTACPGKAKGVIAVGSSDSAGKIARYSGTAEWYVPDTVNFKVIKG